MERPGDQAGLFFTKKTCFRSAATKQVLLGFFKPQIFTRLTERAGGYTRIFCSINRWGHRGRRVYSYY